MANIKIILEIPEQWVPDVKEALNGQAGKNITIDFDNESIIYSYEPKGTDDWVEFAKRAFKEHLINQFKVFKLSVSRGVYNNAIDAIEQPTENISSDIIT